MCKDGFKTLVSIDALTWVLETVDRAAYPTKRPHLVPRRRTLHTVTDGLGGTFRNI